MNWKKLGLAALIVIAILSISINAVLLMPEEGRTSESYDVISYDAWTDIEFYIPSGKVTDTIQIEYEGEDITSHCYIKVIDNYHVSVTFDRTIDINKLTIKC